MQEMTKVITNSQPSHSKKHVASYLLLPYPGFEPRTLPTQKKMIIIPFFSFVFCSFLSPLNDEKKNGCEKDKKHTRIRKKKKINEEELFLFCFRLIVWRIKPSFYLTLYCISSFQVF